MIPGAIDVTIHVGVGESSDFVQLPLDGETKTVKVKIIEIIIERVLYLLTNFQETEQEEGSERCPRDSDVMESGPNLERKEEKI